MSDSEKTIRVNDVHGNFFVISVDELESFYKEQVRLKQELKEKKTDD
tara:strand:- start:7496 stop:7636 length:141 start_codon:yes stop_codon:yes gene_type:complete